MSLFVCYGFIFALRGEKCRTCPLSLTLPLLQAYRQLHTFHCLLRPARLRPSLEPAEPTADMIARKQKQKHSAISRMAKRAGV